MIVTVRLSEEDRWKIEQIAGARSLLARGRGIVTQKIDITRDDRAIDLDGMRGEWAVAKFFGEVPSYALRPDAGWDLYVGGMRADVKSTRHPFGQLLVKSLDDVRAEVYVLAIICSEDMVRIAGWCSGKEYREKAKKFENYGHVGLALAQDRLRPIGELLEYIAMRRANADTDADRSRGGSVKEEPVPVGQGQDVHPV